jgi:hypothetical protein
MILTRVPGSGLPLAAESVPMAMNFAGGHQAGGHWHPAVKLGPVVVSHFAQAGGLRLSDSTRVPLLLGWSPIVFAWFCVVLYVAAVTGDFPRLISRAG